eukprot:1754205-Pleurochrysis_carterae.AAC.1
MWDADRDAAGRRRRRGGCAGRGRCARSWSERVRASGVALSVKGQSHERALTGQLYQTICANTATGYRTNHARLGGRVPAIRNLYRDLHRASIREWAGMTN